MTGSMLLPDLKNPWPCKNKELTQLKVIGMKRISEDSQDSQDYQELKKIQNNTPQCSPLTAPITMMQWAWQKTYLEIEITLM